MNAMCKIECAALKGLPLRWIFVPPFRGLEIFPTVDPGRRSVLAHGHHLALPWAIVFQAFSPSV